MCVDAAAAGAAGFGSDEHADAARATMIKM